MDCNYNSIKSQLKKFRESELIDYLSNPCRLPSAIRESAILPDSTMYKKIIIQNKIIKALDVLKKHPLQGELYYKILYYNYFSPEIYYKTTEILAVLKTDKIYLSERSYYRKKKQAICLLSEIIQSFC